MDLNQNCPLILMLQILHKSVISIMENLKEIIKKKNYPLNKIKEISFNQIEILLENLKK